MIRVRPGRPRRLVDRLANADDDLLHVLIEQSGIGIAVIDPAGALVRANASLRQMVDPAYDLAPGCPVLDIFMADGSLDTVAEAMHAVQHDRPLLPFYASLRPHPGATHVPVMVSMMRLREADGAISGAILEISNISAHRQLETQLAQSQKFQAVGQLAAGVAHDFNNLLTAIIGAVDETLDRAPADPVMLDDLRQIRTSANRGADLVRQLLAFTRQQTLQPIVVSIDDVVQKLSPLLRRALGSKVSLGLDLHMAAWWVRVDPTQLDRVLVNLAVNAHHAMPAGGRLVIRTGEILLDHPLATRLETIPPGRYIMLEVQDTGIGIPHATLSRIFDPFFTTRGEQGGSGLGLSTVLGIVRQSGGYLDVESEIGLGTTFRIYLPRHDAPVEAASSKLAPIAPAAPGGRLILLVDDEAGVRRLATRALVKRGWTVLAAESGEAALDLLHANPDQLEALCAMISDVVMPGMDGRTLVQSVRNLCPDLPAILTSGYAEAMVRGSLQIADVPVLSKPYTLTLLLDTLAQCASLKPVLTHRSNHQIIV